MWCPKCNIEYRKGITVCADCGTELVEHEGEYGVDICEISDEATADEIVKYLLYSGIEGVSKEKNEDGASFKVLVPEKAQKKAEKLFRGYLIAREEQEEKDASEEKAAEVNSEEMAGSPEEDEISEMSGAGEQNEGERAENPLFSDEVEDTVELLHTPSKSDYVKKADKYRDLKFSGITFIIFGFLGVLYLMLCRLEVIPIEYNIFVFCVIAVLFAAFFVYGVVSIIKSGKIKKMIPEEEEKTRTVKDWLDENLTEEMVRGWSDSSASDGENDLLITAHIRTMLMRQFSDEEEAYMEMVADEYYEEHFYQ